MQDIYTKILKSRRFWKVFIPVILFTLISGGLFLFKNTPEEVSAGWWNESWNYRKAIQITNNTTTETDVYIELTLDTSAITTIQPDCGDLRFTTENGQILNYYIVSGCGTASNIININFETFPAGLQNIYFYYGNPSAENGFSLSDFTTVASNYIIGAVGSEEVGLGPVGHWSFDEGYGTTAHDSSSGNNDGIITGATWQDESMCLSGKCLYFDGESSYVEIPDSDLMDINGEMTLEAWIKTGTTTKQTIASIGEEIEIYSKRLGGTGDDYIYDTTVDTNNNLIVVGRVTGNADLNGDGDSSDGGAETAFANYGLTDGIISVFSSSGVHQWSKRFGGVGNDIVYGVTTDSSNNIIITGLVTGDADLNGDGDSSDGGAETATATYGLTDGFISVFNSSGVHQWSKRLGGISGDQGTRVVTDTNNNIILVGTVTGNADLNGDGDSSDGGAETATATYDLTDVFISVFNSSGIYQRSKRLGGVGNDSSIAITTDSDNRIIVEGHVTGNADINGDGDSSDGGAETAGGIYGGYDVFISVFNSSGTYQWSKRLGGVVTDLGLSVTTDTNNNIIVAGAIAGQVDLNGDRDSSDGGAEATSGIYGGLDSFISVFNSSGTYQWAKRMGGTGTDAGIEIITDTNNNVILAGYATGNADLNGDGDSSDGGAETATVTYGTRDITVSVFNSFGIYQWSKRLGGINDDLAQSITRDNDNNIIIAGVIIGDADLNGDDDSSDGGAETVTATYGLKDASISYFSNTGGVPVKNNGYDLFYENNNFSFKSGELISFNSSDTAVNDNSWEHIVYRRNSTNEAFYLNGILLNESAITGYINSNVANLLIGIENASGTNPFLGFIDEVKIYPYARTSDQIKQDYNAGLAGVSTSKGTSVSFGSQSDSWMSDGLVGYWKMDETATTSGAVDSSGNGNDGIYIGNASTTGGRFGNGGIFDGDSDFVSLSGLGTINTISFWVNANSDTEKIMELLEWSCGDTVYNENDGITYQTILADDGNCWLASNLGTSNIATAY
ncbi:MAG: DUF2341 domain-containing protein, partial [Thiomicrorhabdus sp.]|nr:DUF2341 domain-containing protein [Thiomicrorhabdus sp.]